MAAAGVVALESYLATTTGFGYSLQLLERLANTRINIGDALDEIIDDGQSLGTTEHRNNMSENSSIASSMASEAADNEAAIDAALAANVADDNIEDDTTDISIAEINALRNDAMGEANAAYAGAEALSAAASMRSNGERINDSLLALRAIEGTAQNILQNMSKLASMSPISNFSPNAIVIPLDDTSVGSKRKVGVQDAISEVIGEIDMALVGAPEPMSRTGSKMARTEEANDVTDEHLGGRRRRKSKRTRKTRKIRRHRLTKGGSRLTKGCSRLTKGCSRLTKGCSRLTKGCSRLTKRGKKKRRSMKRH
jgi:hypothetical protein